MHPARFEEELFGVEAGADPLTQPRRVGVLERAHGGTLLLDEVSDMPLETQGKIVRALQDQTFERVGGRSGSRSMCACWPPPTGTCRREIAAGRFREDLFYRLAVVPLRVPALKERREDIPALARHFLQRAAETGGMPSRELATDAVAALQAYDWPGNVRQLRNLIDWLLIMAPGEPADPIRADMLPPEIGSVGAGAVQLRPGRGRDGAAAARGARDVRDAVSAGAAAALRRQHLAHGAVRRHGAQRAAPQAQAAGRRRGGAGRGVIGRRVRALGDDRPEGRRDIGYGTAS